MQASSQVDVAHLLGRVRRPEPAQDDRDGGIEPRADHGGLDVG
jgi:hypothetical protein